MLERQNPPRDNGVSKLYLGKALCCCESSIHGTTAGKRDSKPGQARLGRVSKLESEHSNTQALVANLIYGIYSS